MCACITLSSSLPLSSARDPSDVHALFAPKMKPSKMAKKALFRFESSRHAISISSYMKEQRDIKLAEGLEGVDSPAHNNQHFALGEQPSIVQHLVCKPSARNITGVWRGREGGR